MSNVDIFNRPPAISEDTLFYELYPLEAMADKASVTTLAVVMQDFVDSLLPDMQWHRDAFELKVCKNPDAESYMLEGTMRVGDCVDDEWCAVWILREITAKWDVAVRVFDTDGEFLLIEAADHLPDWVTPSNAANRVWIYDSHMHLIPLSHVSSENAKTQYRRRNARSKGENDDEDPVELEDFISSQDALKLLRDPLEKTTASSDVEKAVWQRIQGYPDASRTHVHRTTVLVPVDVARALSARPALVQKAVETFYTRDALQLRAAHRMSRFPPEPSVRCTVRMTRTAYAQLMGQKFYPPKIFGRIQELEGTPEWRQRDIGMKIACGFEMLYQETKGRSSKVFNANAPEAVNSARREALQNNPDYRKFIDNLRTSGYFKGELEGSKLWTELEDKAAAAFVEVRHVDDATRPSFSVQVDTAVAQAGLEFRQEPEDPDDWMNVNEEDFDTLLNKKMHGEPAVKQEEMHTEESEEAKLANEQASRLKSLAQKVEDFIEVEGDIEGARFADEILSDEEDSTDSDDEEHSDGGDDGMEIEFDDEQRATRQAAIDALVPGIEPSEYGQMPPSFHRNSQRVSRIPDTLEEPGSASNTTERPPPSRAPLLARDKYEGVDSDDESDEDESDEEGGSEDERPVLVDDIDIDMSEEQEEFLEFARHALGVTDQQWKDIVNERKDRGAFVPKTATTASKLKASGFPTPAAEQKPQAKSSAPQPNPKLDSFEAIMQAMDEELNRSRAGKAQSTVPPPPKAQKAGNEQPRDKGKGKAKVAFEDVEDEDEDDGDIEAAMEAELKDLLEQNADEDDTDGDMGTDYNLIKNFLESFKSQAGLSGPVGNLAGRLQPDWTLPRDAP